MSSNLDLAESTLTEAVDGLRKAGYLDELPKGLIARAELSAFNRSWDLALEDLKEAREIAERCGMRLSLVDSGLQLAECYLAVQRREEAETILSAVEKTVEETRYSRRARSLEALRKATGRDSLRDEPDVRKSWKGLAENPSRASCKTLTAVSGTIRPLVLQEARALRAIRAGLATC